MPSATQTLDTGTQWQAQVQSLTGHLLISLRDLFVYCQFLDIFKRYLLPNTISSNTSFLIWSTPRADSLGTLKGFQIIFLTAPSAHRPFGNLVFGNF